MDLEYWLKKNKEEILNTLSELIQIKTENLPPGGNEKKVKSFYIIMCQILYPQKI